MKHRLEAWLDRLPDPRLARMLRRPVVGQLMRYGVSTIISASMTVGLPIFLHEVLGVPEPRAVAISLTTAFVINFLVMRGFVFRNRRRPARALLRYAAVNLAFRLAEIGAFNVLFSVWKLNYVVALGIILILSSITKFFTYKFLIFAHESPGPTARDAA